MTFSKITPSVYYTNLNNSLSLFVDCLGFVIKHAEFDSDFPYCVIERDGLGLLLFQNPEYAKHAIHEYRLVTENIQEVYEKVAATHPQFLHPNLSTITLRPWGAKEFALKDDHVGVVIQEWV